MLDILGDQIKELEGLETQRCPKDSQNYIIVRVDGKNFSNFTKKLKTKDNPFSFDFHTCMCDSVKKTISDFNCVIGYTQSDEATFLLKREVINKKFEFNGRFSKIATLIASRFTLSFALQGLKYFPDLIEEKNPIFDGRAFSVEDNMVSKIFLWREMDAKRNAISLISENYFSKNELFGKSSIEQIEMLKNINIDYNNFPEELFHGSIFRKIIVKKMLNKEELEKIPEKHRPKGPIDRHSIEKIPLPSFLDIENLDEVIFNNDTPIVIKSDFRNSISPQKGY